MNNTCNFTSVIGGSVYSSDQACGDPFNNYAAVGQINTNIYTSIQQNQNINPYGQINPNNQINPNIYSTPLQQQNIQQNQIYPYPYVSPVQNPWVQPWIQPSPTNTYTTPQLTPLKIFGEYFYFAYDVTPYIPYIALINLFGAKMYDELISQGVLFPSDMNCILLSKIPIMRRDEKITEILE